MDIASQKQVSCQGSRPGATRSGNRRFGPVFPALVRPATDGGSFTFPFGNAPVAAGVAGRPRTLYRLYGKLHSAARGLPENTALDQIGDAEHEG